jgi:hypothetical protein
LHAEWRARPPAHWLIAAALKYRPPEAAAAAPRHPTIDEIKAAFPGGAL